MPSGATSCGRDVGLRVGTARQRFDNRLRYHLCNIGNRLGFSQARIGVPFHRVESPWEGTLRTTNRVAVAAMATAGLLWPVSLAAPWASAEPVPSPGVPCLDIVEIGRAHV